MNFDMIGPAIVLGLGMLGSAIGVGIGSMAMHGVMSRVEESHGKFMLMAAMPSSQAIYAFILMIRLKDGVLAKSVSSASAVGIAVSVGAAILVSAVYQGMCAATGIQSTAKQPSVFGKCVATLGIVESFSLLAFVFAFQLI
jgi:V/A-type H+/Na+-transporting ATPase subunit K